jgi:hypothetical protein
MEEELARIATHSLSNIPMWEELQRWRESDPARANQMLLSVAQTHGIVWNVPTHDLLRAEPPFPVVPALAIALRSLHFDPACVPTLNEEQAQHLLACLVDPHQPIDAHALLRLHIFVPSVAIDASILLQQQEHWLSSSILSILAANVTDIKLLLEAISYQQASTMREWIRIEHWHDLGRAEEPLTDTAWVNLSTLINHAHLSRHEKKLLIAMAPDTPSTNLCFGALATLVLDTINDLLDTNDRSWRHYATILRAYIIAMRDKPCFMKNTVVTVIHALDTTNYIEIPEREHEALTREDALLVCRQWPAMIALPIMARRIHGINNYAIDSSHGECSEPCAHLSGIAFTPPNLDVVSSSQLHKYARRTILRTQQQLSPVQQFLHHLFFHATPTRTAADILEEARTLGFRQPERVRIGRL